MRRSKATTFGQRGGEGATRGRKMIRYHIVTKDGTVYTKGAFFPCVVATVTLDLKFPPLIQVWESRERAEKVSKHASSAFPDSVCEFVDTIEEIKDVCKRISRKSGRLEPAG